MGKKVEMIGKKIGRLTIIKETNKRDKNGNIYYLCKCDCGKEKIIKGQSIRAGSTLSCGCLHKEKVTKNGNEKRYGTRLYMIYRNMIQRCYNPNAKHYSRYGGRDIIICDEWLNDFDNFKEWAYNNGYFDNLTIDRINNDGNYEPSNCRWVTMQEQQYNKSTNRLLTYNGETHSIKEWSKIKNINYSTLLQRLNKNKAPFAPIDIEKRHNAKSCRSKINIEKKDN